MHVPIYHGFLYLYLCTPYCTFWLVLVIWKSIQSAISAYHHWCCKFESRSVRGVQHYVIKFVSDLRQVDVLLVRHFVWMLVYRNPSYIVFFCLMVFNPTFNNISVISWRSVLLVKETVVPGENHRPAASHWQTALKTPLNFLYRMQKNHRLLQYDEIFNFACWQ
jgi:hypothetical protein